MTLNRQAVFETALTGLLEQKAFSYRKTEFSYNCLYRGPNNTKCAVGFCIPDENMDALMASNDGDQLSEASRIMEFLDDKFGEPSVIEADESFLDGLQFQLHDDLVTSDAKLATIQYNEFDREKLLEAARKFAQHYELEMPDVP